MTKIAAIALVLALISCSANGQPDYVKKGYKAPPLSGATTCVKAPAGNTPALCPVSAGVPLTDDGKSGSTVCVVATTGKTYETVFSLMYPLTTAALGCTMDSDCSSDIGIICGTNGPVGVPNTCFPLAPSGCPFTGDQVTLPTTSTAGRKFAF
jgi:hypothetical protein